MKSDFVIHQAPWVAPINGPIIEQGAVAVRGDRIVEVGPAEQVKNRCPEASLSVRYPDCVLMPALVNAHIHLELSHLDSLSAQPWSGSFTGWVEELLAARAISSLSEEQIYERARRVLDAQYKSGVIALADTGNLALSREIGRDFPGQYIFFQEYLGFHPRAAEERLRELATVQDMCCVAHAPYSTHASLITALKERATAKGHVFSMHVAETAGENELLRHGTGPMRAFLENKGVCNPDFQPLGTGNSGAVRYLDRLNVLDEHTLCVHGVHVTDEEVEILVKSGAKVCLCPGSNEFLGVGHAPLERYLAAGIIPALGTDSKASNPRLSLWREMRLLAERHPQVEPATIMAMATLGGARALGLAAEYGSLEKGKKAEMLAVMVKGVTTAGEVASRLVLGDETLEPVYARADVFTSLCNV